MIVVIADDVSGAAELAGAALRHGLTAEVQTAFSPEATVDVVCVTTETRSLPPAEAADRVRDVALQVISAKPAWLFKKCDSVLRGPVLAEARAIANATGKKHIVIAPANPSRHRIIRDGIYRIAEQPLHETAFARDPEHACLTSRVAELLGGDLSDVSIPDVESAADVTRIATAITDDSLAVGALDLFAALLRLRVASRVPTVPGPEMQAVLGPRMLVCGSAASWHDRHARATALGIPVFTLINDVRAIVQALESSSEIVIGIGDGPETRGISSAALVSTLAQTVSGVLRQTTVNRLLLEGGATTAAVMRALGWTRLRASEVSVQGVGILIPLGAPFPTLFIKPGSYPWPDEIWPPHRASQTYLA